MYIYKVNNYCIGREKIEDLKIQTFWPRKFWQFAKWFNFMIGWLIFILKAVLANFAKLRNSPKFLIKNITTYRAICSYNL